MTPADNVSKPARRPARPHAPYVTLTVTPEIIAQAEQRNSSHCMWAEAVKAAIPGAKFVSVDLQTIRFTDPEKPLRYTYLTPQRAQVTLIQFDQGIPTESCSVALKGGQVTKASSYKKRPPSGRERMPEGSKAELRPEYGGEKQGIPAKIGGTPPPTAALTSTHYSGKRREFGLKLLVR